MKTHGGNKGNKPIDDASSASSPKDVALVVGRTEDRKGLQILRKRGAEADVEFGTVRPLEEGKPIDGEVVGMRQRKEHPFLFDVKTEIDTRTLAEGRRGTSVGPAQVASEKYRAGWDAIWGDGGSKSQLN